MYGFCQVYVDGAATLAGVFAYAFVYYFRVKRRDDEVAARCKAILVLLLAALCELHCDEDDDRDGCEVYPQPGVVLEADEYQGLEQEAERGA